MVAPRESATLAKKLIAETCRRERIEPAQLTLHANRGRSMTSKSVAFLLADLGVTKTHSRPHVSNDNPFSESAFKTLKYRPDFPERFGGDHDARGHCGRFFDWYNHEHRHGALGLCTPYEVHHGLAAATLTRRATILDAAFLAHPERFSRVVQRRRRFLPRSGSTSPSPRSRTTPPLSKFIHGVSHAR